MTGGILKVYADQGVRTVLVTCTDGALCDTPEGITPDAEHHDPTEVAKHREAELRAAAAILRVSRLELLGYPDSGMEGWPQNEDPRSFWRTPVEHAAARLAPILLEERPQVVVTYDENGFYGHPDHIQTNRVTRAALEMSGLTAALYYTAIPLSAFAQFRLELEEGGVEPPPDAEGEDPPIGTPDELVGATIDVAAAADAKFDALAAHGSQTDSSFFLKMGRERFTRLFSTEWFVRANNPR